MMSGLLYALLFLAFGGSLCNPARIKNNYANSPTNIDSRIYFPSDEIPEEIEDTNTLSIYKKDNTLAKPVEIDNRLVAKFAAKLDNFHKKLTNSILAHNPGQNLIYSPISISTLLMMMVFGSRGMTLKEILLPIGIDLDLQTIKGFEEIVNIMKNVNGVELEFASILFASKNIDVVPDYQNIIHTVLKAKLQLVNFGKPELTARQINDWCKKQTKNQITEIIKPAELSDIRLMLANAIYFKGDWMTPFDVSDTKENVPFFVNKTKTVSVSMMHLSGEFNYGRIEELKTRYIELPYAHGENDKDTFSMYLFIPFTDDGLELLENNLNLIDFKRLNQWEEGVEINVPKFKIQSKLDIKPILQKMGMKSMFMDNADFRGLVENESLYLSKVVQKASLTVNEQGSTAAAVSVGGFTNRMSMGSITANRPFICAIVLKSLGLPVFFARIVDPTASD